MKTNNDTKKSIEEIVKSLFADGKSPLEHYGIDGNKIERIEMENPHVSKQYPKH